jgi:hypothetical protein
VKKRRKESVKEVSSCFFIVNAFFIVSYVIILRCQKTGGMLEACCSEDNVKKTDKNSGLDDKG